MIREMVVPDRSGPLQAEYSTPEFLGLGHLPRRRRGRAALDAAGMAIAKDPGIEPSPKRKMHLRTRYSLEPHRMETGGSLSAPSFLPQNCAVTNMSNRWRSSATRWDADRDAIAIGQTESIGASLVLRADGYRGEPVLDLLFDHDRGVIDTNRADSRRPSRSCSRISKPASSPPRADRAALTTLVRQRRPELIEKERWHIVNTAKEAVGLTVGRPRIKRISVDKRPVPRIMNPTTAKIHRRPRRVRLACMPERVRPAFEGTPGLELVVCNWFRDRCRSRGHSDISHGPPILVPTAQIASPQSLTH